MANRGLEVTPDPLQSSFRAHDSQNRTFFVNDVSYLPNRTAWNQILRAGLRVGSIKAEAQPLQGIPSCSVDLV
jgi:hypothetical protein